jgi:membrane-bound ClpP family serine protease
MIDKSISYNKTALNTIHLINLINITFIEVIKQKELREMRLLGSTQHLIFSQHNIFFTQALKSSKDQRTSIQ